jgi:hypothetical protein
MIRFATIPDRMMRLFAIKVKSEGIKFHARYIYLGGFERFLG